MRTQILTENELTALSLALARAQWGERHLEARLLATINRAEEIIRLLESGNTTDARLVQQQTEYWF